MKQKKTGMMHGKNLASNNERARNNFLRQQQNTIHIFHRHKRASEVQRTCPKKKIHFTHMKIISRCWSLLNCIHITRAFVLSFLAHIRFKYFFGDHLNDCGQQNTNRNLKFLWLLVSLGLWCFFFVVYTTTLKYIHLNDWIILKNKLIGSFEYCAAATTIKNNVALYRAK